MSKIISKDHLDGYRTWAPPAVDGAGGTPAGVSAGGPNLLTASQLEQVQKQAYDEAYAVGLREGRAAGRKELTGKGQQFDALMRVLAGPFEQLDEEIEHELVDLVTAMVRQLVRREIKAEPGQVMAVVREALAALPAATRSVRLHLHPEDAVLVRHAMSLSEEERTWKIVEDPVVSRGGCRVMTEHSQIDATVETRLNQLFTKVFGGERTTDEPR
jgi:flagellar assembly protein FliH